MKINSSLKLVLVFCVVFFFQTRLISSNLTPVFNRVEFYAIINTSDVSEFSEHLVLQENQIQKPFSLFRFIKLKQKNKKLTAAFLAFPFPFGILGLHRIYLGTAPYIPVVYIGSFGGVFGILPLMDFIAILMEKDIDKYINNNKVFMWVK